MSHHTPWKIRSGLSEHSSSIWIEDSRRKWVADVKGCHDLTSSCGHVEKVAGFPTDEEAEANALLIIAAPDLLEALEYIAILTGPDCSVPYTLQDIHEAAQKAIEERGR